MSSIELCQGILDSIINEVPDFSELTISEIQDQTAAKIQDQTATKIQDPPAPELQDLPTPEIQDLPTPKTAEGRTSMATGSGFLEEIIEDPSKGESHEMKSLSSAVTTEERTSPAKGSGTWTAIKTKAAKIAKHAKSNWLTILTIILCVSDVTLDGMTGISYIQGTNYVKTVSNLTVEHENCTLIEKCTTYGGGTYVSNANESDTKYTISCFEKDPWWGFITLFLMFLPAGFVFPDAVDMDDLFYGHKITNNQRLLMHCITILLTPFYPVSLLSTFLLSLFIHTPRMKRLVLSATQSEGTWEASLQLALQVYIILSRTDRRPSPVQILSLLTTIISANKTSIETYLHSVSNALRKEDHKATEANLLEGKSATDNLKLIVQYLPVFLTTAVFRVGTITVVIVLLKYWASLYYGYLVVVITVLCCIAFCPCVLKAYPALTSIRGGPALLLPSLANCITLTRCNALTRRENKLFLLFTFVFYFIINTVTVILLTIAVETGWWQLDHWDQLALVQDKWMFRGIIGTVLGCGLLSWPLFLKQIFMKEEEQVEEEEHVEDEELAVGEE